MHTHGNPHQWNGSYPDRQTLLYDINNASLYVCGDEKGSIYACFALTGE